MTPHITYLKNSLIQTFGITDASELDQTIDLFEYRKIRKGDILLEKGKKCPYMIFIISGYIRVYVESSQKEVIQWIASKDYFLTDLASFIHDTTARWNMEALTDCDIYIIKKSAYNQLQNIVSNWHQIEKTFIIQCFITLEERVHSHLSLSAEERYASFFEKNKELFNQVPLQYIASMLGMTPETFSRIRRKYIS